MEQNNQLNVTPWSVAHLNQLIADRFKGLPPVWVEGEITSWNVINGNVYASLHDLEQDAKIDVTIWRSAVAKLTGNFAKGDRVAMYGTPSFYIPRGTISFNATQIVHIGLGDFLERIERLKAQLKAEGLFDNSHKKKIPFLPNCIGLVTGMDSDAEKDVKKNVYARWPEANIKTEYALVQGDKSAAEVTAAIAKLDADPEVDVIIVARGGGDLLHLLSFSDERVVRAAFAAKTPIISAIGHEADNPLLDYVADLRASTPTDAAKRVVPDMTEEMTRVGESRFRIRDRLWLKISTEYDRIQQIRTSGVMAQPERIFEKHEEETARNRLRLTEMLERNLEHNGLQLEKHLQALRALSPLQTLARGYAVVQNANGSVLQSPESLKSGDDITVTLQQGKVLANVTETVFNQRTS